MVIFFPVFLKISFLDKVSKNTKEQQGLALEKCLKNL